MPTVPPTETSVFSLFSLKGRVAIVTGAGDGIGLSISEALAEAGANVVMWYNSNPACIDRAKEIAEKYSVKTAAEKVDVCSKDQIEAAVQKTVKDFGRIDIFVANAGIPWTRGPMLDAESSLDHYNSIISTDLTSVFNCAYSVGRIFRSQRQQNPTHPYGSFIATASMSGHIVNLPQQQAAYNAAKAGLIHFCRSLAVEWVEFARVNSISPGYIITPISKFCSDEIKKEWQSRIPMGREALPHELKGAYLYLASDAASYTTGTDILVDGGYVLP
ncbi:hypothetical protein HDV00_010596 [Rhizophlyctis rosea]|nr:hypothetical protein HDV00_010596 [Rhizophlyctis rosea]